MLSKVLEVFGKEYRRETEYQEFMEKNLDTFKLNNKSEDVGSKVDRLTKKNFVSNFRVKVGDLNDTGNV